MTNPADDEAKRIAEQRDRALTGCPSSDLPCESPRSCAQEGCTRYAALLASPDALRRDAGGEVAAVLTMLRDKDAIAMCGLMHCVPAMREAADLIQRQADECAASDTEHELQDARIVELNSQLADANYWRERWCKEQQAAATQSHEHWTAWKAAEQRAELAERLLAEAGRELNMTPQEVIRIRNTGVGNDYPKIWNKQLDSLCQSALTVLAATKGATDAG